MKFPRHPRHGHLQSSQGSSRSSDDAKVSGMRSWHEAWASPYIRPGLQGEPFDREVTGGSPQITFAHVRHIPSPTSYLGVITSNHNTIRID